ncbi:MAG: hypothetical protein ROR55_11110 [Devosia sp.]
MLPNNAAHATLRYRDDPNGSSSGASFVVFGKPDGTAVELSDVEVGTGGFVINGVSADDLSGRSVSRAGDVNGDGFDDLIVRAPFDDPNGSASGASFVVLGGDFSGAATQVGIIGDDPLISTAGADVLFGGTGNDTIEGNGGDDRANGARGTTSSSRPARAVNSRSPTSRAGSVRAISSTCRRSPSPTLPPPPRRQVPVTETP